MKASNGKTLCIILHYGSEHDTNSCIRSMFGIENLTIVVSDNDPHQSYVPDSDILDRVKIIRTGGVAGFSEGNNIGVNKFLSAEYSSILILNNDTIVADGAIDLLRETLEMDNVGAVGPCMPYLSDPSKIWACGGYVNNLTLGVGGLQPEGDLPYVVGYLPGAAILLRSELWEIIGGFNEAYFLAYEEVELCLEIKRHGFLVMADPRSIILHKVGMSSEVKPEYYYNGIRNRLIFSRYLFGNFFGLLYGVVTSLFFSLSKNLFKTITNLKLCLMAIADDLNDVKISREIFQSISKKFKRF
jgi:GT2 family glycosyltransferase